MEITLKFNLDNNFDPIAKEERISIIRNALWVINCALGAINISYSPEAPRLSEMRELHANLMEQIREQITDEEAEELKIK